MKKTLVSAFGFIILMVTAIAFAAPVPDTGQSKCYNATVEITCPSSGRPFYGQDANYSINHMSYTKLDGSGNTLSSSATSWVMVKDNVTGLVWENKTVDGTIHDKNKTFTWYDSNPATNGGNAGTYNNGTNTENFIKALNDAHYGGYSDWRLPTIKELTYIVNFNISWPGPMIDNGYFPNTADWYWSSTPGTYAYGGGTAVWLVDFGGGVGGSYGNKFDDHYVRAVRGGQPGALGYSVIQPFDTMGSGLSDDVSTATGSYTDNGDGTVTDTSTSLTWQKASSSGKTWEQALAYCEGLNLGDHTDWRLPSIKELRSLVDYSRYGPAINTTYFPDTVSDFYWSSTTGTGDTHSAWLVYFDFGYITHSDYDKSYRAGHVRAVRGGQPELLRNLVISPTSRNVAKDAGSTTFSVSNTGTGTMPWTAAVTSGSTWLSISSGASGTDTGTITCSFTANTSSSVRTATIKVIAPGATGSPVDVTVTQAGTTLTNSIIGSNSIDSMDVVKITDMSGLLPDGGVVVTVRAWDKDGKQLTSAGYASPLSIINHGTTSILGADLEDRFPDGTPAAYTFSVESSKMFITNINNSSDGAVRVPIIYSNGLSNFVSNSIGTRNTLKVTDISGTIASGGIAINVTAWDAIGNAIPESTSATPLKLYNHGTTSIDGKSLPSRFPSGAPMTYEFTIDSPKLVISNVKNSSDGTLNIPTVYTIGVSNFVANSIGAKNTIYISDFSGTLGTGGVAIVIRAWNASGTEIPESVSTTPLTLYNHGTNSISGANIAARFPSGSPMTYEFTVDSSKVVITNIKSSSDGSINIPTVYTSGITKYTTNYVSDLNTIRITDMSGSIPTGGASITITARDVDGNIILESGSAVALKLANYGTTTIEGGDLQIRFPSATPVTYEFSIGSSIAIVTNLTKSSDGTINIPTVFTIGPYGGI
jgi:hypothetical protein